MKLISDDLMLYWDQIKGREYNKMKVECPACKQQYELDETYNGQKVECPCGHVFECLVPNEIEVKDIAVPFAGTAETKRCPFCGEEILLVAKKCRYCGEFLEGEKRSDNLPKNDILLYVVLALFLGVLGGHNFYKNQRGFGIFKLILFIVGAVLLPIGGFVLWIVDAGWCLFDVIQYVSPKTPVQQQEVKQTWTRFLPLILAILIILICVGIFVAIPLMRSY